MKTAAHHRVLIGALTGIVLGVLADVFLSDTAFLDNTIQYVSQPLGQIFLRLLFMLVVPLVFSGLVLGVAGLGDVRKLGRIGLRTLLYTVLFSSLAVLIGLVMANVFQPGAGVSPEMHAKLLEGAAGRAGSLSSATKAPDTGWSLFLAIIPTNPVKAAAEADILGLMFFALMVGIGLTLVRTDATRTFESAIEGLYEVTMKLIGMVIALAPIGVAALLFTLTAQLGFTVLVQLGRYTLVVVTALAIQQFVVYALTLKIIGRWSPLQFYRAIQPAMLTAFSTASSSATLSTSLKVAEEELKLPRHVSRFVLTLGATANQNGTALFEGITVLFLAQFYDVPLGLMQQVTVMFICILGGIGTAGVPAGSLPVIALILGTIGVPVEGIGVVLGVDRLLDMCRTTVNVSGDLAIAALVSRGEETESRDST